MPSEKTKSVRSTKRTYIEDVSDLRQIRSKSFAEAYPKAARMWLYERNCGYSPEDFSYRSHVYCWFKCPRGAGHIFQLPLSTMGRATEGKSSSPGCGLCRGRRASATNNLAAKFPHLVKEWMTRKNGKKPDMVNYGSPMLAWWKCPKRHVYQATVNGRTSNNSNCPRCKGFPTDLRDYPEVLKDFDFKSNKGVNPFALPQNLPVNWVCHDFKEHKWTARFRRKSKQKRCPYCTNRRVSKQNNLAFLYPKLAKQWHPTLNGDIKPKDIVFGSGFLATWICLKGPDHVWQATVAQRVKFRTGCPFCSGRLASVTNVLTTVAPDIAGEWHERNGKAMPDRERFRSDKKRWWKCSQCSHSWQAKPYERIVLGRGCPACAIA